MTITQKLLVINSLICAAFVVVTMVVFFSFRHVEEVLTTTFASESRRIVENSNMTRELSRVLSDMNLVISTFYEKDHVLETGGAQLVGRTRTLLAKTGDEELRASLQRFTQQIKNILGQCEQVNFVRGEIGEAEEKFDNNLIALDNIIAERLVDIMAEGGETWDLDQLSSMIGGWRESFIRIKLQFVRLGLEHFRRSMELEHEHPLPVMADDLLLRLRTLTAAAPEIAEHGRYLITLLTNYKASVSKFHQTANALGKMLEKNDRAKENLLSMMERTDRQVAKRTEEATGSLTVRINRAVVINLLIFLGILPIVILGGMTAYSIKKPIQNIIRHIEQLSKGDIPKEIDDEYKGEFARVRDYLNMLIRTTNSVTQIAENIASGNMEVLVRERSENDRLMQALNRMIQRLNEIMSETGRMIQAVGTGTLEIRGNAQAYEGGWRELVSGVNDLIDGLSDAVSSSAALAQEMEVARRIQTVLLPKKPEMSGYDIAANCEPSEEVGGDYYDVISVEGYDWIVIGDVSGHGITAGLVMMMVQTAIHTVLVENPQVPPSRLLSVINKTIYNNIERMDESKHMTIIVLAAGKEGKFSFSGLHEDILIRRAETGKVEAVESDGMWIGIEPDISEHLSDDVLQLESGDCMVLFTDGITEAWDRENNLFGDERLMRIIEESGDSPASQVHKNIIIALESWKKPDDVTLVVVRREG